MTIKKEIYSYTGGLDTDTPPSKRGKNVYSMLRNGRITSSYSSGAANNIGSDGVIRCANGNQLSFGFGQITGIDTDAPGQTTVAYGIIAADGTTTNSYTKVFTGNAGDLDLLGASVSNCNVVATYSDGPDLYLLTTSTGFVDCIWKYTEGAVSSTNPDLIYIGSLGWSESYNYDIVVNHESESVKRMYIADGIHQVFAINLSSTTLLSKPRKVYYMVPSYSFSQPVLASQISGGNHTPGYVQYAYNLFNISGGQTNLSPLSEMIVMGRSNGGGDVNEIIGKSNVITISNIDAGYDYIRVYSIKYSDLDVTPTVNVVGDYSATSASINITDDGRPQYVSSIETLQFLGGIELVPRCIVGKKNRLIIANIKENPWDINNAYGVDDSLYFDSRCYSSTYNSLSVIVSDSDGDITLDSTGRAYNIYGAPGQTIPITLDAYQDKTTYLYHPQNLTTPGGEGRHLSYKILKTSVADIAAAGYNTATTRYMKSGETYRWAIQFYNAQSQKSTPQWIADVKIPAGYHGMNDAKRVTIQFDISPEGVARLDAQGVIGYKFLRVERKDSDKSIVAQGIVTPMIFQRVGADAKTTGKENATYGETYASGAVKVSCPWVRHYQDQVDVAAFDSLPGVKISALSNYGCISPANTRNGSANAPCAEIYRDYNGTPLGSAWLHLSYQENRLLQLFSPETTFGQPQLSDGMKYRIVGSLRQSARKSHGKMISTDSSDTFVEVSSATAANLFSSALYMADKYNNNYLNANGYIGPNKPTYDLWRKTEQLIATYREYAFNTAITTTDYSILKTPELAKHDTAVRTYNGYSKYKYQNTLQNVIADGRVEDLKDYVNEAWDVPLYGVDSIATQNITFVDASERPYETIMSSALGTVTANDNVLLVEIYNPQADQYGGRKYEDRTLNKYIEVGQYKTLADAVSPYSIYDNGDTFIDNFTFARIARIDGVSFSHHRMQMTEMVKFPCETSINLANRSDNSYAGWEAQFLPTNDAFHQYNKVFSQEGNAIHAIPDPYLFTKNTEFSNRILASKPKISGETIDSWLDILPNEELYVEGEYGPINRLLKLNDSLYCFQRDGVAVISVLPRVQVQTSDSIAIELGVGQVLNTYQYLNTQSGCDDFNGIISTSSAVYYADKIRRSINIISSNGVSGLSDKLFVSSYVKGFDTTYAHKPRYTLGFDPISDDVLFAIRKGYESTADDSEVLMFSENANKFFGIYDFSPEFLFTVDGKLHSIPTDNKNLVYTHFTNDNSCKFYGVTKPLELTICLNPEGAINDNIFNTVEWTHDVYNTNSIATRYNDNITAFTAWNEYLTSVAANISDIRRRFRISRLHIPRVSGYGISRMRGQYLFIKMTYTPSATNKSIVLNDLILYYNAQRQ